MNPKIFWAKEARDFLPDPVTGTRITRLSGSSIRTENIYCDTPRATADGTPEEVVTRLHNAWLGREEGCRKAGHANRRSRLLSYGKHVQVIELCNSCFRTGKREHRQLAQSLVAGREARLGQP